MENEEEGYLPVDPDVDLVVIPKASLNDEKKSDAEEPPRAEEMSNEEESPDVLKQEKIPAEIFEKPAAIEEEKIHLPSFVPEEGIIMGSEYPAMKEGDVKPIRAKGKKKILVAVILILSVAVVAAAYIYYPKPEVQPVADTTSENSNDVIVKSALEKMRGVKTFNYDGKVDFDFDVNTVDARGYKETQKGSVDFKHSGVADFSQTDPNIYSSMVLDGENRMLSEEYGGDVKTKIASGMELIYLDRLYYLKLNNLDLEFPMINLESNKLIESKGEEVLAETGYLPMKNNWYFVPAAMIPSIRTGFASEFAVPESSLSSGSITRFGEIIRSHNLLEFSKDLGDDKVGETDTYHYQVRLDGVEGFDLAVEMIKANLKAQSEEKLKNFEDEFEKKADEVKKTKELMDFVLNKVNVELWIGKGDDFIYRMKIDGNFDDDFLAAFGSKYADIEKEQDGSIDDKKTIRGALDFGLDYTFSNFNTAAVRKPEGAKDLQKVITVLEYQTANGVSKSSPDTDGDKLSDKLENLYKSDARKIDTDGDGYNDGDEVDKGYDPIVAGSAKIDYDKIFDSVMKLSR